LAGFLRHDHHVIEHAQGVLNLLLLDTAALNLHAKVREAMRRDRILIAGMNTANFASIA